MPFRVLRVAADLVVVELTGTIRWPDVAAALRTLYGHPHWIPGSDVLWDASRLASVDVAPADLADVRVAFEEIAEAREGGRTAFLIGTGGFEELWALFPRLGPASTRRVEVFNRRADALGFLGRETMPQSGEVIG
jgi:hypothetical protein